MELAAETTFPTTRWTLILEAKTSPEARRAALTALMTTYWRPLYAFLRRKGLDATAAQDGVQDVLLQLLERDALSALTPERGRLRGFLRTTAANWLVTRHEKDTAQKRGAGAVLVPIDAALAERLARDDAESPEEAFDRAWASAVMTRAMTQLEAEYASGARSGPFSVVTQFFGPAGAGPTGGGPGPQPSYREVAQQHGMTLPQLKAFLHRARVRYRELVAAEIADTVTGTGDVDAELAALTQVLA